MSADEQRTATCPHCRASFTTPYPTKVYCNDHCARQAGKKRNNANHPERRRAAEKRRAAQRTPEQVQAAADRRRRWYEANREAQIERARKCQAKNPEAAARWKEAHPDRLAEYAIRANTARGKTSDPAERARWETAVAERKAMKELMADPLYQTAREAVTKRRRVVKSHGLTDKQYAAMRAEQGGACAICGRPETKIHHDTGTPYELAIDHDHDTGRVRGLLCASCNVGIGYLREDTAALTAAINYLLKGAA